MLSGNVGAEEIARHLQWSSHYHIETLCLPGAGLEIWSRVPGCYPARRITPAPLPGLSATTVAGIELVLVFGGWDRHRDIKPPIVAGIGFVVIYPRDSRKFSTCWAGCKIRTRTEPPTQTTGEEAPGVNAMLRECTREPTRMTRQLLTNSCQHTSVGLLAAQQPIQCNYNMHSILRVSHDCSFCLVACTRRLKLGERAGVPPHRGGGRQRSRKTSIPSKTTGTTGSWGEAWR